MNQSNEKIEIINFKEIKLNYSFLQLGNDQKNEYRGDVYNL